MYLNYDRIKEKLSDSELSYIKEDLSIWLDTHKNITDKDFVKILKKIDNEFNVVINESLMAEIIYELIEDINGILYGKEIITGLLFPLGSKFTTEYTIVKGVRRGDYNIVKKETTVIDTNIARFSFILRMDQVASKLMIDDYKREHDNNTFKKLIQDKFDSLVYKNEITPKEDETLETQNELTKIMEDTEFLLNILKKYSNELYIKYESEYKKICYGTGKNLVYTTPAKCELLNLISNIKLQLLVKKENCDNFSDYLISIANKYFEKMLTNNLTVNDLNINNLDSITGMFLKQKDEYSIQDQRKILRRISMLYLFVTKNNIDNLSIEQLEKSYFKDNIKSIFINILKLSEDNFFTNNIEINFDENISIEYIFSLIKELEFNKNLDENKKLIK